MKQTKKIRLACTDYENLLKEKQAVDDQISITQRERDLKVDTVNKRYERSLSHLIRKKNELEILIKCTQQHVANNK